ncbi:MAG: hypothetical protein ACYTGB_17270 [Planctomycetota bacterium]
MKNWFLTCSFLLLASAEVAFGPLIVSADGAGPDLVLVLAVFLAIRAPWGLHLFFYLALGTFSDIFAVPHPGLRGFTYVLVAIAIERVNPGKHRRNPAVLGVLCAAGALFVELVYLLVAARGWPEGLGAAFGVAVKSAMFTGLAGLLLGWPLNLTSRAMGWPPSADPLSWSQLLSAAASGAGRIPRKAKG